MAGRVGAGEVAHHQRQAEGLGDVGLSEERVRLGQGEAHAVHAGVDVERGLRRCAGAAEGRPLLDFREGGEHRAKSGPGIGGGGAFEQAVEDIDRRLRQHGAEAQAFFRQGDEEGVAAGRGEGANRRFEPDAIAVALDHGRRDRPGSPSGEVAPVGGERAEIDGQAATGEVFRALSGHDGIRRARDQPS